MLVRLRTLTFVLLFLALVAPAIAAAQTTDEEDLAAQIEELKKGQQEIRQELRQIRALIQQRQAPAPTARPTGPDVAGKLFDIGDNPVKGAATARLTLVEFTDYQ